MNFRFLTTGFKTAAMNMAIDEALIASIAKGAMPSLRLYGWNPPAISIGYFQSLEEEVDIAACKREGVDIVRRATGGGAVLHEHEITYSIHIPESLGVTPQGILESYQKICGGVIRGLKQVGIDAEFVPLNDLIVVGPEGPQKISGNAQTRKQGIILQHGTILLDVNVEKMFSLLKVPSEKMKGKLIEDVKKRVTSISARLGRAVSFDEIKEALFKGFQDEFAGVTFMPEALSDKELTRAEELKKGKYDLDSWNNWR